MTGGVRILSATLTAMLLPVKAQNVILCHFAGTNRRTMTDGVTTGLAAFADGRITTGGDRTGAARLSAALLPVRVHTTVQCHFTGTDCRPMADVVNTGSAAFTGCRIVPDGVHSLFAALIVAIWSLAARPGRRTIADGVNTGCVAFTDRRIKPDGVQSNHVVLIARDRLHAAGFWPSCVAAWIHQLAAGPVAFSV